MAIAHPYKRSTRSHADMSVKTRYIRTSPFSSRTAWHVQIQASLIEMRVPVNCRLSINAMEQPAVSGGYLARLGVLRNWSRKHVVLKFVVFSEAVLFCCLSSLSLPCLLAQ